MIDEAAQKGTYKFQWGQGSHVDDVTSYMEAYHTWGPEWVNRPEILFQYDPPDECLIPTHDLKVWYDQQRIVLGYNNVPVRRWSHLPATISSRITGQEIEALLRLDRRTGLADLMARMPKKEQSADKVSSTTPILHSTHFSNIQREARLRLCCRSWTMRRAGPAQIDRALELYLLQHFPQFKITRSVKGFHDLDEHEQNHVKALCKEMQGSHNAGKSRADPPLGLPGMLNCEEGPTAPNCCQTSHPTITLAEDGQQGPSTPNGSQMSHPTKPTLVGDNEQGSSILDRSQKSHPLYNIRQLFVRLWEERNSRKLPNLRPLSWPDDGSEKLMLLEEMEETSRARKRYEDETGDRCKV